MPPKSSKLSPASLISLALEEVTVGNWVVVLGPWLDLMISELFIQFQDSVILHSPIQPSLETPGSPQRLDSMIFEVFFNRNVSVMFCNIPTLEEFKQTLLVIGKAKSASADQDSEMGKALSPRQLTRHHPSIACSMAGANNNSIG